MRMPLFHCLENVPVNSEPSLDIILLLHRWCQQPEGTLTDTTWTVEPTVKGHLLSPHQVCAAVPLKLKIVLTAFLHFYLNALTSAFLSSILRDNSTFFGLGMVLKPSDNICCKSLFLSYWRLVLRTCKSSIDKSKNFVVVSSPQLFIFSESSI